MDVRSAAQTDHARSIAILIGVADADHTDHELRPVPATLNSLRAMHRVLTDKSLCGWPAGRITVLRNPDNAGPTARRLRDLMRSARDTLVVYYAGQANLTASGQLCLALSDTTPDAPDRTGLSYSWVARTLRDSPARRKVVILDCCLPGRDGQFLDPVSDEIADLSDVEGVYTLTSTTRHHPAPVVAGMHQRPRSTVFTGQLVEMVEAGLPGGPAELTLEDLYPALRQRLVSMGLPPPHQRGAQGARLPVLTRNAVPQAAGAAASAAPTARSAAPAGGSVPSSPASPARAPELARTAGLGMPPEVGPALAPGPGPAPMLPPGPPSPAMLTAPPGNGARTNGHSPATGRTTGPTPVVRATPGDPPSPGSNGAGARPVGARPIAGPEPPRRNTGSQPAIPSPPPPPPPSATDAPVPPPAEGADPARSVGSGEPAGSGAADGATDATGATGATGAGAGTGATATADAGERRSRRRKWVPAVVLALALLVPALYALRTAGGRGAGSGRGIEVDLRDVGNRTITLDQGIEPIGLLQDDDTLWVQSGAARSSAELAKIDLTTGEVIDRVPFPESDSVGSVTVGAGSLWVTTSSIENMSGAVVRIDPDDGKVIATVDLPAWPGRTVFTAGSLWVATVLQPVAEELGAGPAPMSSTANALSRIDPETNEVVKSIALEATPLDVRAADNLVLVSTEAPDDAAVVAIDPATEREVARVAVPAGTRSPESPDAAGPWMLFAAAADPYAVRVDIEAEKIAAVTGPRVGVDMVVPNGEQMWELRAEVLTILDENGDEVVTVTVDGTPLAATAAGRAAAWIAYRPSDSDEVLVTRVPAAELLDLSE